MELSQIEQNDDFDVFIADFSIPGALRKVKPLKDMYNSKEKIDKKVIRRIIMNAVLLQEHNSGKGAFQTPPAGLFNQEGGGI